MARANKQILEMQGASKLWKETATHLEKTVKELSLVKDDNGNKKNALKKVCLSLTF